MLPNLSCDFHRRKQLTFAKFHFGQLAVLAGLTCGGYAMAATVVTMYSVDGQGTAAAVGTVTLEPSAHGVIFTPSLTGLPPGLHGFHVHENPSCEAREQAGKTVPAAAAGGHFDPAKTGRHEGPWGQGHLGDLPALVVDASGESTYPVLAPRLRMADLKGRALMIHAGGDNHADHPTLLGGGGARLFCGVTP